MKLCVIFISILIYIQVYTKTSKWIFTYVAQNSKSFGSKSFILHFMSIFIYISSKSAKYYCFGYSLILFTLLLSVILFTFTYVI